MKKLFLAGLVMCGLLVAQYSYSQDASSAAVSSDMNNMSAQNFGAAQASEEQWSQDGRSWNQGSCTISGTDEARADHPCDDQATNDCWCKYVHYEPCYYYTKRCVTENKYCTKKCCRQVPKYYEVQRCKMVPQYYTETCCKMCPEYYDVQECVPCKKWVCDRHCKYVPRYYWKHTCGQQGCPTPCPR